MTDDKKFLVLEQRYVDPYDSWPFVVGVRERLILDRPMDPKRWQTARQQRAWEQGWKLADEMVWMRKTVLDFLNKGESIVPDVIAAEIGATYVDGQYI